MKKFITTVLLLALSLSAFSANSLQSFSTKKNLVKQLAYALYETSTPDKFLDSSARVYAISTPLIASAIVDKTLYQTIDNDIAQSISTVTPISMQAWMTGRLLMAAVLANDQDKINQYKIQLENLVSDVAAADDVMTGWAVAYLASLDETTYNEQRDALFYYIHLAKSAYDIDKSPEKLTNLLWTITMGVYASANANNQYDYEELISYFTLATGKSTIAEAIKDMPISDYEAWLLSLNYLSAKKMHDKVNTKCFEFLLDKILLIDDIKSVDRMMALANLYYIKQDFTSLAAVSKKIIRVEADTSLV